MLLLPATMFHLLLAARSGPARLLGLPPHLPAPEALWSPAALLLWLTWLGLQAALYLLPARKVWTCLRTRVGGGLRVGLSEEKGTLNPNQSPLCLQMAEGQELKDKSRLRYPINGAWGWALRGSCAGGLELQVLGSPSPAHPHLSTLSCSICCCSAPQQQLT